MTNRNYDREEGIFNVNADIKEFTYREELFIQTKVKKTLEEDIQDIQLSFFNTWNIMVSGSFAFAHEEQSKLLYFQVLGYILILLTNVLLLNLIVAIMG